MSDLTIILPLKDRSKYTYRWMEYANQYYKDYKIIIADGGKDKDIQNHLSNYSNYKDLNYSYIRYPYDSDIKSYFEKISNAINKINTKYAVISDNDDFFINKGIKDSISFLEANKDYSCSRGVMGQYRFNIQKKQFDYIDFSIQKSIVDDSYLSRLEKSYNNYKYRPSFYDVHRTENLKNNYNLLRKMETQELQMVEILPQFLDVINGKIARLDSLYLMREIHDDGSSHEEYLNKEGSILHRVIYGNFKEDFLKMNKILFQQIKLKNDSHDDDFINNFIINNSLKWLNFEQYVTMRFNTRDKNNIINNKKYISLVKNILRKIFYNKNKLNIVTKKFPEFTDVSYFLSNFKLL